MNTDKKRLIINSLIAFGIGLVIAFLIMWFRGILDGEDTVRIICDGFTVSGLFILGIAVLMTIGQKGEYDALGYLGYVITPIKKVKYINYANYKEAKTKKREENPKSAPTHMFIAGGAIIFLAVIFLILYFI